MNNIQLYHTNIALGGQVKWDLIIENGPNGLIVDNFGLSPISREVKTNIFTANKSSQPDNLLDHTHLANLKQYYADIKGSFYNPGANPLIASKEPIVVSDDYDAYRSKFIDPHDPVLECGLNRAQYSVYKKPYEFFCPIWLEDFTSDDVLIFRFIVLSGTKELFTKSLSLETSSYTYHNQFVKYFNEYIDSVADKDGKIGDKLFYINLLDNYSYIRGIDVEAGKYESIMNITDLSTTLLETERLLMDNDSILCRQFEDKHIIAPQLINFNFIFDIEDIITKNLLDQMWGSDLHMNMEVIRKRVSNGVIERKSFERLDFFTNYDNIDCEIIGSISNHLNTTHTTKPNIFDEIGDNIGVSLLDKNKTVQNLFHWSLADNKEYIFNLYSGFGGCVEVKKAKSDKEYDLIKQHTLYQNSPNIWSLDANQLSPIEWCNGIVLKNDDESKLLDIKNNPDLYLDKVSILGREWCNMLKYGCVVSDYKSLIVYAPSQMFTKIRAIFGNTLHTEILDGGLVIDWYEVGGITYIFIAQGNESNVVFTNLRNALNRTQLQSQFLKDLQKWMDSIITPKIYSMKLVGYSTCTGPDDKCNEVEHYKTDKYENLARYDGYIKPCFINLTKNNIYIKRFIKHSDITDSAFAKYANSGFEKLYPSIDYYAWEKSDIIYEEDGIIHKDTRNYPYEYKWLNEGQTYLFHNTIEFIMDNVEIDVENKTYTYQGITKNSLNDWVLALLKAKYNTSDDLAQYIYNLYEIKIDWDYQSNDCITKYKYTIKLQLK